MRVLTTTDLTGIHRRKIFAGWGKRLLALTATATVAITGLVAVPATSANAATLDGQIVNSKVTITGDDTTTATWNGEYKLEFEGCLPPGTQVGDTWTMQLPTQIAWPTTVTDSANKVDLSISSSGLATFTVLPAGLDSCFSAFFSGQLKSSIGPGDETLTVVDASNQIVASKTITVTGIPAETAPTEPVKLQWFTQGDQCKDNADACIAGELVIPAGHGTVRIEDSAGGNWEPYCATTPADKSINTLWREYNTGGAPANSWENRPGLTVISCDSTGFVIDVDTSQGTDTKLAVVSFHLNAKAPGGSGLVTYNNTARFNLSGKTEEDSSSSKSSYAGVITNGPSIHLIKRDSVGNDANDVATSVELPSGSTGLEFTIVNNGTQTLRDLTVTDAVTGGSGQVENINCHFPGGSTGTVWSGPFDSQQSFVCTADLSGVAGEHVDVAKVVAFNPGGVEVSDDDPYHAHNNAPEPVKVSIGDYVWIDADGNGQQDNGEAPIADVEVKLLDAGGNEVALTKTNNNGYYVFADLDPATKYTVVFPTTVTVGGVEYELTDPNKGESTTDSNADTAGKAEVTTPATGGNSSDDGKADEPTIDAGYKPVPKPVIEVAKNEKGDDVHNVDAGTHEVVATFTNTGTEDLTDLKFVDETQSGQDVQWNAENLAKLDGLVLKVGETVTVRGTVVVKAGETHKDTVTVTGKGVISGKPVDGEDPTTYVPPGGTVPPPTPEIDLSKNKEGDDINKVDVGTHEIVVTLTNTGDEALKDLVFSDTTQSGNDTVWNKDDLAALNGLVLEVGESVKVRGTVAVADGVTHKDTASINATGVISGKPVADEDPTTYVPVTPEAPGPESPLATTGAQLMWPLAAAGAIALLAGGVLLMARRRQEEHTL